MAIEASGAIDTMIGFRQPDGGHYVPGSARGDTSGRTHAAAYMFKKSDADETTADDVVAETVGAMDDNNVAVGLISSMSAATEEALQRFPDRFALCLHVDATDPGAAAGIADANQAAPVRAVSMFPAGVQPPVAIDAPTAYPIYAQCAALGLPVFVNAGVPGPLVPTAAQHVAGFDSVCYDFPELTLVMRHGAEPWADLAVKLMLKWPGLHYSTSAFAPRYYPQPIVNYANTRGAEKVLYAGYHPYGLHLDRIFKELDSVPFDKNVRAKFLRDNAVRVLDL